MTETECPDRPSLQAFLLGRHPPRLTETLERHLLACRHCQHEADQAPASDVLCRALAQPAALNAGVDSAVEPLMDRLRAATQVFREVVGAAALDPRTLFEPHHDADELGRLGGFRILRLLGCGGMGAVYEAEDLTLGRRVAVKVMRPELASEADYRERFLREARAIASLHSDHIVPILQVDTTTASGTAVPYFVMPLLAGESLEARLKGGRRLRVAEVVQLGRQAAAGLHVAHAVGLVHRDIKPGNLWLEPGDGATPFRVKILDFGLVRHADQATALTGHGSLLGTPAYLAPEQAENRDIDGRADLFSLGCVLYQALTGRRPFAGKDVISTLRAIAVHTPPAPRVVRPDTPGWLSAAVVRLLAKDPDQRIASAAALADLLGKPPPRRSRRSWLALVGGLAACTVLAGGFAAFTLLDRANPDARPTTSQLAIVPATEPRVKTTVAAPAPDAKPGKAEMLLRLEYRGSVSSVVFSPDGKRFVAGDLLDATPVVRDTATGMKLRPFKGHTLGVAAVAFSADGHHVLTGSWDKTAILWDAATGEAVRPLVGHTDWVTAVAFSADGKKAVTASNGPHSNREVFVWDTATGQRLLTLEASAYSVAFTPDGKQVLACFNDAVRFWDALTGRPLPGCRPTQGFFLTAAPSPDGTHLLAAGSEGDPLGLLAREDPTAMLFSIETKTVLHTLKAHAKRIGIVAYSPDGRWFLTASFDGTAVVWDAATRKPLATFEAEAGKFDAAAISAEGKILTGGHKSAVVWEVPAGNKN